MVPREALNKIVNHYGIKVMRPEVMLECVETLEKFIEENAKLKKDFREAKEEICIYCGRKKIDCSWCQDCRWR